MRIVRNDGGVVAGAAADAVNRLRGDLLRLRAGLVFHASATVGVSIDDADEELEELLELANELREAYVEHIASVCHPTTGHGAHIAEDAANRLSSEEDAEDEADAIALLNDLKAQFNAHRVLEAVHAVADSKNSVTSADAEDLPTAIVLANEIKAKLNAHFVGAFTSEAIRVIAP